MSLNNNRATDLLEPTMRSATSNTSTLSLVCWHCVVGGDIDIVNVIVIEYLYSATQKQRRSRPGPVSSLVKREVSGDGELVKRNREKVGPEGLRQSV